MFMGEPKEIEMPEKEARARFKQKMKGLEKYKGSPMYEGSFIGVKDEKGKWLITNEAKKKLKEVV
jgi:hypothetical protein